MSGPEAPRTAEAADAAEELDGPAAVGRASAILAVVVFLPLYGWFLYQAFGNLLNVPPTYAQHGLEDRIPWALLLAGVALPLLLLVGAALLGRGRSLTERVLVLAAGLAATAATSLSLYVVSAYLVSLS